MSQNRLDKLLISLASIYPENALNWSKSLQTLINSDNYLEFFNLGLIFHAFHCVKMSVKILQNVINIANENNDHILVKHFIEMQDQLYVFVLNNNSICCFYSQIK